MKISIDRWGKTFEVDSDCFPLQVSPASLGFLLVHLGFVQKSKNEYTLNDGLGLIEIPNWGDANYTHKVFYLVDLVQDFLDVDPVRTLSVLGKNCFVYSDI